MKIEEYYNITPDKNGWRLLPSGNQIELGYNVSIAETATIGNFVNISSNTIIGDRVNIGYRADIGDTVIINAHANIGAFAKIGDFTIIGAYANIEFNAIIGNNTTIDARACIGNETIIGDCAIIGPYQTTEELNKYFISTYPEKSIFWKWVTNDLMSPGWGKGKLIKYEIGSIIEEPYAKISDQQCDVGLHVFRPGIRPEFAGLCGVDATKTMVCLEVEVNREDICFGGLPGNSDKLRVKKLKVLRKLY